MRNVRSVLLTEVRVVFFLDWRKGADVGEVYGESKLGGEEIVEYLKVCPGETSDRDIAMLI